MRIAAVCSDRFDFHVRRPHSHPGDACSHAFQMQHVFTGTSGQDCRGDSEYSFLFSSFSFFVLYFFFLFFYLNQVPGPYAAGFVLCSPLRFLCVVLISLGPIAIRFQLCFCLWCIFLPSFCDKISLCLPARGQASWWVAITLPAAVVLLARRVSAFSMALALCRGREGMFSSEEWDGQDSVLFSVMCPR